MTDHDHTQPEPETPEAANEQVAPRDEAGRFMPGHSYGPTSYPNATVERRRNRVFREAMLDVLNDPKATLPMKGPDGQEQRVPIAKAVAMQTIANAMKGNGAAIRAIVQIAGTEESVDSAGDTVVIRFARGGYMDRRPTDVEGEADE